MRHVKSILRWLCADYYDVFKDSKLVDALYTRLFLTSIPVLNISCLLTTTDSTNLVALAATMAVCLITNTKMSLFCPPRQTHRYIYFDSRLCRNVPLMEALGVVFAGPVVQSVTAQLCGKNGHLILISVNAIVLNIRSEEGCPKSPSI